MDPVDSGEGSDKPGSHQPSPTEFDLFLTWACNALGVSPQVFVSKIHQTDYVSVTRLASAKSKKSKPKTSKENITQDGTDERFAAPKAELSDIEPGIQVQAFYDSVENLVKLYFDRNSSLPQRVFKIIGLIIQFYYYMHNITINGGLNKECVYEISKFLPFSKITDLCLDNAFIEQANYHLLLERTSLLRNLSLARCKINDATVELIAGTLHYPSSASKTLCILNLSTNRITDVGAKYLAECLRSNRQLNYLNLSGNMLTDEGASHLLESLTVFPLRFSELLASRSRHMVYLKKKNELVMHLVKELRLAEFEKRAAKRKSASASAKSAVAPKKKGLEKEGSMKSVVDAKTIANEEALYIDKASLMAESTIGVYSDPFDHENTESKDGIVYCQGNNALAYLSMAYNNLSYMTLKKLLQILKYQKATGRRPRGLINISIEGNLMPTACKELAQIDDILEMGLMVHNRRFSLPKKRLQTKSGSGR